MNRIRFVLLVSFLYNQSSYLCLSRHSLGRRPSVSDLTPKHRKKDMWSKEEHELFLEGLKRYGKSWKAIHKLIPTRTLLQIRTHAQKVTSSSKPIDRVLDPTTLLMPPSESSFFCVHFYSTS